MPGETCPYLNCFTKYAVFISSFSDEMQTVTMSIMDNKELEKKFESDIGESDQEVCCWDYCSLEFRF